MESIERNPHSISDAMGSELIDLNPAWRTFRYSGLKSEKKIADEGTIQKIIAALEEESIKYEVYYKSMIATGIRCRAS